MPIVKGETPDPNVAAVYGESTNNANAGPGVHGVSRAAGCFGESKAWHGVAGLSQSSSGGAGVYGQSLSGFVGVLGESTTGAGVEGRAKSGPGVFGQSDGSGVWGKSTSWHGVTGESQSTTGGTGVYGRNASGLGVLGESTTSEGVVGRSASTTGGSGVLGEQNSGIGVRGSSQSGVGVWGSSQTGEGMHAETRAEDQSAIAAYNLSETSSGAAVFAKKAGTAGHAGFFDGNVWVSGELRVTKDVVLMNEDCAEDFDMLDADRVEPGTVMVVGKEGLLLQCERAYDKRVAGVVSGAGDFRPGIVLGNRPECSGRKPIALLGKVFCKVDATHAAIEVGDLLATSDTPGHAMKANDPQLAFGAVIGKALRSLDTGKGLIPILVSLQ